MKQGLRLLFYDDTCRTSRFGLGLTHSWIAGARLYTAVGKFDGTYGATNWGDALRWLATYEPEQPIQEIQYWGHGKWGRVFIAGDPLTADWLEPGHAQFDLLSQIRDRMMGPDALWWFRTCETFGAEVGHRFAERWTDFFDTRAAGHTYIIGPLQSGLHAIAPGQTPEWSTHEGLEEGTPDHPTKALWSVPGAPRTVSFLKAELPQWAFVES